MLGRRRPWTPNAGPPSSAPGILWWPWTESGQLLGFADLEPDGHLDHLFVHKDHQRRGIGTLLLTAIEAIARREAIPVLRTEASLTARPFFEAHGFALLAEQTVRVRGVAFVNFRMAKEGTLG